MTPRHAAPRSTPHRNTADQDRSRPARRSWLRWPSTLLPALLLTAVVGLSGGGLTGASSSSAPLVNITVTGAEQPTP